MKNFIVRTFLLTAIFWSGWLVAMTDQGFFGFDGKPASLEGYTQSDNWTVVMFWASDCTVCNAESQQYVEFYERHKGSGIQVLGISLDGLANKGEAEQFIERNRISFPNLLIDSQQGADFYTSNTGEHWIGTPTFMIYAPKGELKAAQIGAVPVKLIEDYISSNRS